ncbi:anti-sigma factor family protein [Cognatilysobacter lacus]|uniref:Anti-sigma factor n=1 Tax=Cognatilysobacter lacus TaxID=1643323 RepID=A0A5D8Z8T3_9GAMM|nr:hypothetical protein [Lysobacter lacus]TZF91335.1 hypothetical protein FW784_02075 [Lysobacter lacus]
MTVSDQEVQAYVDGELAPPDIARVEAAIAADVLVAARVERARRLRGPGRAAFDTAPQPAPSRLEGLLVRDARARDSADRDPGAAGASKPHASRWRIPAIALAALVAALAIGNRLRKPETQVEWRDTRFVASAELARRLDNALAGSPDAAAPVRIELTFRDSRGRVCRSFVSGAWHVAGLACREGGSWTLPVVGALDASGSAATNASSTAMPAEVLVAIDERMRGGAFDAVQERRARASGWR